MLDTTDQRNADQNRSEMSPGSRKQGHCQRDAGDNCWTGRPSPRPWATPSAGHLQSCRRIFRSSDPSLKAWEPFSGRRGPQLQDSCRRRDRVLTLVAASQQTQLAQARSPTLRTFHVSDSGSPCSP